MPRPPGRVRVSAFGISIAAHVIAILLYTSVARVLSPDGLVIPLETDVESEQGVDLIQLIEFEDEDLERPEDPEEIERVAAPAEDARPPFIPLDPGGELVPPGPTACGSGLGPRPPETATTASW